MRQHMQSFVLSRIYHNLAALFVSYCSKSSTLFPVTCLRAPCRRFRVVRLWKWDKWDIIHFWFYSFEHFYSGILALIPWIINVSRIRVCFFANTYVRNLRLKINLYCRDICMNKVNTWDTHIRVTPNHTSLKGLLIACAIVFVRVMGVCRSDGTPAAHLNVLG